MLKSICGVILVGDDPERLAAFYARVFGVDFEREEHAELLPHFGVDVGALHFAIHPPTSAGGSGTCIAFNVDPLDETLRRARQHDGEVVSPPHDEGFGLVAALRDPDGNLFELVELAYDFERARVIRQERIFPD